KATGAAGGAIPRRRNGKVFLDLELNRDFNGEDYEYEDEAKLVIFPDHFEIPLPNIEELPALVSEPVLCFCACWKGRVHLMVPWLQDKLKKRIS
ncbi:Ubiquitin carboxyl-terminal hydrolase 13, partial [Ameca splendens]